MNQLLIDFTLLIFNYFANILEAVYILTLDTELETFAGALAPLVASSTHVVAGGAPGHLLQHQRLVAEDDTGRHVVHQRHALAERAS